MESPCHWIDVAASGQIFIGSLTGDVFRWYRHWLGIEGGPSGWRGADPCREDEPAGFVFPPDPSGLGDSAIPAGGRF